MKTATCDKCGWVAFQVDREFAEDQVKLFNEYFDRLTKEEQMDNYGGRPSKINDYEECMSCGGSYKNFHDSKEYDCPDGVTLNPIIKRDE